jgi:hypothetical protein
MEAEQNVEILRKVNRAVRRFRKPDPLLHALHVSQEPLHRVEDGGYVALFVVRLENSWTIRYIM